MKIATEALNVNVRPKAIFIEDITAAALSSATVLLVSLNWNISVESTFEKIVVIEVQFTRWESFRSAGFG